MNHSTRKVWLVILLVLIIIAGTGTAMFIKVDRSLEDLPRLDLRKTPNDWASHIKIGVIGDSWVAGNKLDSFIIEGLKTAGIEAEVISSGHPGARSRQIYRDLLADEAKPYSARKVLMDPDVDYLVLIAGVNDTAGHIGKNVYAHHVFCIVRAAQQQGIHPLVLEVPEYGIRNVSKGLASSVKHLLYKTLFDGMKDDVIGNYRQALRLQLSNEANESVTRISFDPVAKKYSDKKDLYANSSHLNAEGCHKLGILIATSIAETHNHRLHLIAEKAGAR